MKAQKQTWTELHITPTGAHFVDNTKRLVCDEGCCEECDSEMFESIDGLTSEEWMIVFPDMSGFSFDAAILSADHKTLSCGCPMWWLLAFNENPFQF